jgi:hypothetical protein
MEHVVGQKHRVRDSDRSIPVGTWKRGEIFELRNGDKITSNGGPYIFRGKVLNLTDEIVDRLLAKKRLVPA